MDATWNSQKIFCVLYVSISLMLQIEKKKKWVSPTKRVLDTKMNYDTKFYYSQNCPHSKKFDRSLAKNNFLYNLMDNSLKWLLFNIVSGLKTGNALWNYVRWGIFYREFDLFLLPKSSRKYSHTNSYILPWILFCQKINNCLSAAIPLWLVDRK